MPSQAPPKLLLDQSGNEVRLAPKPFATGGEGAVFDVQNRPDLVAKLYSKPQSRERCDKLRAMAKLCSPDLLKIAAWPTATLHSGNPADINGILMPRIAGHLEIHHLYSVAQRKKDFPEADWGFLLHTARNCAIAFESVHRHGHVVGDVNQKNVMVSQKGIVALVDCDSFQVREGSRVFRCGVGVPEYTPPELHGKSFASLDRDPNHDLFGLAVLIFHLLMMGRHPFSGVPLVKADIPIEKAIQEGLYAYTRNTATARLKPPPHVPPVTILDPNLLDLFDRSFCTPRRPTASEWRVALDAAMKHLVRCANDSRHAYLAPSGQCPWCGMIATARLMFFLPTPQSTTSFRLEDLIQLIQKVASLELAFKPYSRLIPSNPLLVTLPPGLRAPARRPVLHPLPSPPTYPPRDQPPPPDPFLSRLCLVGGVAGLCVMAIARPVGFLMVLAFAVWWGIMQLTERRRQESARRQLEQVHRDECARLDAEYAHRREQVEAANRRLVASWEAANAVWVAEEKKWKQRSASVTAEMQKLESELHLRRTTNSGRFDRRKKEAEGFISNYHQARLAYEKELIEAESNSRQIQLDEFLDRALIRDAKLKAITNERILSLESFGIQSAKDVDMLKHQKVPGIGPVLTDRLFAWRHSLASRFTPKQGLPDVERSRIASRYAPVFLPVGQTLKSAIGELEGMIASHRSGEVQLLQAIGVATHKAALAEAHLHALNNLA